MTDTHAPEHTSPPTPDTHGNETSHHNETTAASNSWLEKAGNKTKRWIGHGLRFAGNELALNWGTGLVTTAGIATVLSGGATAPIMAMAAAGGALAAGGGLVEWDSMKHAKSKTEKGIFILSKVAQTVGTGIASGLAVLGAPAYLPAAWGMYGAGLVMGARAQAHRK